MLQQVSLWLTNAYSQLLAAQDAGRQSWRGGVRLQRRHSAELPAEGLAGHDAGHLHPHRAARLCRHAGETRTPSN